MRIDRRLTFIGVMLIVLSMTMATQYATTKVSYTFGIVHPSNADIRFVGSDNSSADGLPVLRVTNNATQYLTVSLGDWFPNSLKNYTAAFAICNEESFPVSITHVNLSGDASTYIDVWVHNNRTTDAGSEVASAGEKLVAAGVSQHTAASVAWVLAQGDGDVEYMNGTGANAIYTDWDPATTGNIRYNGSTSIQGHNSTHDFVWVQISINIPPSASPDSAATGQIWFHFAASTHD